MNMRVFAPAKINLHLRIGPLKQDGYHPLLSWMVSVGLFDTLAIERAPVASDLLSCDDPGVPVDGTNLVLRAVALVRNELTGGSNAPEAARAVHIHDPVGTVSISLAKRIPAGSGLGGGSSDGARTLLALNRLWQANLSRDRLLQLAARLGSDLPFFIDGQSAVCTGRGEHIQPLALPSPKSAVLILSGIHLSTPAVYREFDRQGAGFTGSLEPDAVPWQQWHRLNARELLSLLVNDLEPAAFTLAPALGALRERAEQTIGQVVRMSGSGSALFTLFDTPQQADAAADALRTSLNVRVESVAIAPRFSDDLG